MSTLNQSLKALYQGNISDGEVALAKDNLLGFFKLLQEIDIRLQKEANLPQNTPQNAIQSILQSKTTRTKSNKSNLKSNKSQNDNNRD